MEALPFATKPLMPSNWTSSCVTDARSCKKLTNYAPTTQCNKPLQNQNEEPSEEPIYPSNHFEYMPAVLLNSLKRDKKPFTYTPGRLDLSEVLNAKLQKRIERKKKRYEDKLASHYPPEEMPVFHPPKQVLVKPTYNSPLDMYSMENALEALEAQAEIAVSEKSISPPQRTQTLPRNYKYEVKDFEPKNVTQSKAFKVLQIITDTDEIPDEKSGNDSSHHVNEMNFRGTRPQQTIPSKYFHTLQKMTGTDKDHVADSDLSNYNKGIQNDADHLYMESKFTGIPQSKVIPSKYFQNLQRLTGTEESDSSPALLHESRVHENNIHNFQSETRFSGIAQNKVIPSKYFQSLQRITGTDEVNKANSHVYENRDGQIPARNVHCESTYPANKSESNEKPVSFQPRSFPSNSHQKSIPVLQRPAAFLPATKKNSTKTRTVRFDTPDMPNSYANSISSYEGTDF